MNHYRIPGEFEPQESVLTVWPVEEESANNMDVDAVTTEMISHLVNNIQVLVVCYNEAIKKRAIDKLTEKGVDISKIEFYIHKIDNQYPRDFGAEVAIDDKGHKKFIDFNFVEYAFIPDNLAFSFGEGMRDFNKYHARITNITESIPTWIASEGGDREFNGHGIMMAIEETEVNKRNPGKTKQEIEEEFKQILNLNKIIWIPKGTYDDDNMLDGPIPGNNDTLTFRAASANGHIDEMCRFVNENTILIAHISEEEAKESLLAALNRERLEEAHKIISEATDQNGNPFRIVKIPVPEPLFIEISPEENSWKGLKFFTDALGGKMLDGTPFPNGKITVLPALSYCNFLITNHLVIAQKYWKEGLPETIKRKDEEALKTLQQLFPQRKVVAIDTLALNLTGGGIHCHTRNIPK